MTSVDRTPPRTDIADRLRAQGAAFAAYVGSLPPAAATTPVPAVPGWTVADVAAHVLTVWNRALGDFRRSDSPEATAALNATCLEELTERDLGVLAEQLGAAAVAACDVLDTLPADLEFPFHAGATTTVVPASSVILAEVLVHGHDLASAAGSAWPIPADDARACLDGSSTLLPAWLDDAGADLLPQVLDLDVPSPELLLAVFRRGPVPHPLVDELLLHLGPL